MKVLENLKLNLIHYSCDNCWLEAAVYPNGRLALQIMARDEDDSFDEPIATATINLVDAPCAENEIYIKDYSENAGMVEQLVAWGVIEGKIVGSVRSGYVTIERYRLMPGFMLKLSAELIKQARGIKK